jgi:AcrR family transcriptional regulator
MVERIIDAAQAVLLERGYQGASTNRIAERAGISPGSFYQYFPDKEAVLAEVLDRYTERLRARISRAFLGTVTAGAASTAETVRGNIGALLDALEENPGLLRALAAGPAGGAGDERRRDFARQMDQLVTTILLSQRRGQGDGPARPLDTVAWLLVRTTEHTTISYVLERPPLRREDLVDELTAMITGYLDGLSGGSSSAPG